MSGKRSTQPAAEAAPTRSPPSLGGSIALVAVGGLAFATSGPLTRYARPAHSLLIVCGRVALAAVVLLALHHREVWRALRATTARQRAGVAFAGLLLAAHFTLFVRGLQTTSLPAAVTLVSLEPLSVVAWVFLLHRSRPGRLEWLGLSVATLGAVLVARGAGVGEHRLLGDLLVVGAVVLYGLYLATARALREALPPRPYVSLVYFAAAMFAGGALVVTRALGVEPSTGAADAVLWPIPRHAAAAIVALALVPTLIGHTAVQVASRHGRPALVALCSPGETVGSIVIGALWLGAVPSRIEAAGAGVIVAGVTLAIAGAHLAARPV